MSPALALLANLGQSFLLLEVPLSTVNESAAYLLGLWGL